MAYTNSPLATYTNISPNKTSPRNHAIDTITIHCIVGQWTAKQGCDYFAQTTRQASCNYVVGKDGSIGLCVEEKDRSWCSSNAANDHRAITIETASDTTHPYAVTDKALAALIDLCTDICERNGIKELKWKADKSLIGNVDEQNMTVHRWFANKACPGDYLYNLHGEIASQVNARLSSGDSGGTVTADGYDLYIWNYFKEKTGNEYGVAGLMGNLYAESGLHPDIVQGDIPYSNYSKEYTADVDSGAISESDFVNNGPGGGGYGLAQWTFYTRKQGLYDMWRSGGYSSIGSIELACDYLYHELRTSFPGVLATLENASSIREASDVVLHDFESPADQSASVEAKRAENALFYYNKFSGSSGAIVNPDRNPVASAIAQSKLSKLLFLAIATDI